MAKSMSRERACRAWVGKGVSGRVSPQMIFITHLVVYRGRTSPFSLSETSPNNFDAERCRRIACL